MHACLVAQSCRLSVTPWTVSLQAPLSMGLSRQEYWSGLPFPSPGDLPNPGIEPTSTMSSALADGFYTTDAPEKPLTDLHVMLLLVRKNILLPFCYVFYMPHFIFLLLLFSVSSLLNSFVFNRCFIVYHLNSLVIF